MLTLVKLPDRRAVEKARQEKEEQQKSKIAASEAQQLREAERGRAVADNRGVVPGAAPGAAVRGEGRGSMGSVALNGGGGGGGDGASNRGRDSIPSRRSSDGGGGEWAGERRGCIGYDDTVPQPKWRGDWHRVSRPSVPQLAAPPSGKRLTYVDREAPDIDLTPAEVRSTMRVKMRKMLREAQIAGALDEVEMLQLQIAELDRHR
jgi:hypothetical protein